MRRSKRELTDTKDAERFPRRISYPPPSFPRRRRRAPRHPRSPGAHPRPRFRPPRTSSPPRVRRPRPRVTPRVKARGASRVASSPIARIFFRTTRPAANLRTRAARRPRAPPPPTIATWCSSWTRPTRWAPRRSAPRRWTRCRVYTARRTRVRNLARRLCCTRRRARARDVVVRRVPSRDSAREVHASGMARSRRESPSRSGGVLRRE